MYDVRGVLVYTSMYGAAVFPVNNEPFPSQKFSPQKFSFIIMVVVNDP